MYFFVEIKRFFGDLGITLLANSGFSFSTNFIGEKKNAKN